MKKAKTIMIIYALIASLFITYSYSALNNNLYISGGGVLRANVDVRVTNIVNSGYYGEAIENFNPNFNTDLTNLSVDLPTSNSYVTYTVTVENKGDPVYLYQIDLLSTVSNNVEIKITNGTTEYTLPNNNVSYFLDTNDIINYTLTVRNKNNSTNNDVLVSLKYYFMADEITNPIITYYNPAVEYVNRQNSGQITVGDEVALGSEHFYVVSSDATTTKLLSKYDLKSDGTGSYMQDTSGTDTNIVKVNFLDNNNIAYWDNANCQYNSGWSCTGTAGLKSEYANSANPAGTTSYTTPYPEIYDSNAANIYQVVNSYTNKLASEAGISITGKLMTYEQASSLSTNLRKDMNGTWYWLGSAYGQGGVRSVYDDGSLHNRGASGTVGVRPVIEVPTSEIPVSNGSNEIQLVSPGTATFGVDHYEYFVSQSSVTPSSSATATGTTNGTLSLSNINYGHFYVWYRTVSTKGTVSSWSNSIEVQNLYTLTYNSNGGSSCSPLTASPNTAWGTLCASTKESYRLAGWFTDNNAFANEVTAASIATSNLTVYAKWVPKTLYSVLENEYNNNTGFAKLYSGSHQDSMDASKSTSNIYYWYGSSDANGTAILDKNNVVFAEQCWQMIRTTDTGGVRMIYNGEAVNNQCLNTRGTHIGYASRTSQSLSSNYWYGTDYTYDSTNKVFSISGTTEQTRWNARTGPGLVGKYTCKGTTETGTCSTLYLVESYYNTSSGYVIPLNSSSNYSQFGTLQFNVNSSSPADVGYMYNTRYTYNSKTMTNSETMLSSTSLGTTYWYANSITWGTPTANSYNLDNPYQVSATTDYPNLVGEYTFRNATKTYTGTSVYYIAAVNNTTMYYIQLTNTGNHTLADFNYTYTYGDSYTDNGNGTYTINNPTTINRSDWYSNYNNIKNKYVCKNATNDTCSDLWYTTATSNTSMTYIKVVNDYKYSKGFIYKLDPDDNKYKYFLDDATAVSFWNINDSTNKTSLNNAHYTCFNTAGKCTTLSYIHYLHGITPYYINLTGGKSVEDALEEMLSSNDVNSINSTMKSGVDAWYKKYILADYDNYIDDTIYCNDRSIGALNGWNPDGGSLTGFLQFKEYNAGTDLSCTNITDRFSISNNNARLTYKVGLMSSPEMNLLNQANARKTGQIYWLASPGFFTFVYAYGRRVSTNGSWADGSVDADPGVRPAVSLVSGIEYSEGDGSVTNPYVVKEN